MNKLLSSRSKLNATLEGNDRRARTRTLIQVGGIVKLSGLFPICRIEEGDNLQYDIGSRDNAALLLGILLDAVHNISDPPDAAQMETWRASGTRLLKQRAAQMAYQKRR
jgi:hypothetical protein